MATVIVPVADNTYVDQSQPLRNFKGYHNNIHEPPFTTDPAYIRMVAGYDRDTVMPGSNGLCRAFIKFTTAGVLPLGAVLDSAILRLYKFYDTHDYNITTYDVNLNDASWTGDLLTWNTQPSLGSFVNSYSGDASNNSGIIDVDVTSAIIATIGGVVGFTILVDDEGGSGFGFGMNLTQAVYPLNSYSQLILTYHVPAGGRRRSSVVFAP